MTEDSNNRDDELAELLADEDRVRDVLLAAVDGQLMPPARTDLAQIVRRGKRRARMQVLAASVAAAVLIAAVALGASVLAHWNGSNQVSTANGPATALPVTAQTITTTADAAPTPDYADDASQPTCLYPGLTGPVKWVPLNVKQGNLFRNLLRQYAPGPTAPVNPAALAALAKQRAVNSVESVAIYAHDQLNLVTISATAYSGPAAVTAQADSRQLNMPQACVGTYIAHVPGKAPPLNEYVLTPPRSTTGQPQYLRAQIYESSGVRYDVTEVVNPSGVPDAFASKLMPTTRAQPVTGTLPPALTASELAQIAFQVAAFS